MTVPNDIAVKKIEDLVRIFMNMYRMTIDMGGVEVSVPEILLAVNAFHAAVILDIARGGSGREPMTVNETKKLCEESVRALKQALSQEA